MNLRLTAERVFQIFKELNHIPRPSHHEERVADYLCQFAERLGLSYQRDEHNCVVIRKPATVGHEHAEPIVLLNHMDMVCVGMDNPLTDTVEAYTENGWMKARGTSLGADNGIGLSMALAVLESADIVHGPLEVITTTNEEDGMSGAANLSADFIRGRKVINLDSEDYDTITTGAAGACLQFHSIPVRPVAPPHTGLCWCRLRFSGGLGGHSGVDINKGRCSAVVATHSLLRMLREDMHFNVSTVDIGEANASIASHGEIVLAVDTTTGEADVWSLMEDKVAAVNQWLRTNYPGDPNVRFSVERCDALDSLIPSEAMDSLMTCLSQIPQGVVRMSGVMKDTVETSRAYCRCVPSEWCHLRDGDVGTCMAGRPAFRFPATHVRHLLRRTWLAPAYGSDALCPGGRLFCREIPWHPDGKHRTAHRRAALSQRTGGAADH